MQLSRVGTDNSEKQYFHVEKDFSPKIHDDGTLEKGGNIEDAQEKSVEDLVHLLLQYEFSFFGNTMLPYIVSSICTTIFSCCL